MSSFKSAPFMVLLLATGGAHAGVITQTETLSFCIGCPAKTPSTDLVIDLGLLTATGSIASDSPTGDLKFNRYSGSGTLKSVSFSLTSFLSATIYNSDPTGLSTGPGVASVPVGAFDLTIDPSFAIGSLFNPLIPDADLLSLVVALATTPLAGGDLVEVEEIRAGSGARSGARTLSTPADSLASFVGSGTFDLTLGMGRTLRNGRPDNGTVSGFGRWNGTVSVTYKAETVDPDPGTIPEPATLTLVGLGALLGHRRLRRRG